MDGKVVLVTPEIAGQWLSNNDHNRPISTGHVAKLSRLMAAGSWVLNGEAVIFDDAMTLLDGQHRLHAVIKSGVSVKMMVVTGVSDKNAFQTYDNVQRARSASQIANMIGVKKNHVVLVSCARIVHIFKISKSPDEFASRILSANQRDNLFPHEVARYAADLEDEFIKVNEFINQDLVRRSVSKSTVIGATIILNRINPEATRLFWEKISSGVFSGKGDPCLQLRDRIMAQSAVRGRGRAMNVELTAIIVKAWNAFLTNSSVGVLKLASNEKFPNPIGAKWSE